MNQPITVTFPSTYSDAKEALSAAAPFLETRAVRFLRPLHFWLVYALMVVGILALISLGFDLSTRISIFYALLTAFLLAYGILFLGTTLERHSYAKFSKTELGSAATVDITETGFTLRTSQSNWRTDWGGIEEVFETTNTVGVIHAMGPTFIPKSALDDPKAVFIQMRNWHQADRNT